MLHYQQPLNTTKQPRERFAQVPESNHFHHTFLLLPQYKRYNKVVLNDKFRKKSEVIDLVKGLDIPVIDIHQEVFANHPDPLSLFPLRSDGHYTADGYREVTKAITQLITLI